ncbi:MAG TPA: hypothetical protein VK636_18600 [Gemmatimonadaceae bacterium]|nr:hypothetical protein [Gemmatimonadaceae bacterium]
MPLRPDVARANTLKAADIALGDRLMLFSKTRFGREWLLDAFRIFLGLDTNDELPPDLSMSMAIPWVLFSMITTGNGQTLAELWRREQARHVTPDQRLLLDAYVASWLSVWEVADVERGVGTTLVDLLTRERRFVHDVNSSNTLEPLDAMLAFVLDCDGVSFFGGVHARPLPPRDADLIVREARRMCRVRTRPVAIEKLRDSALQLELIALWDLAVDAMDTRPAPVLTNTDGDLFALTQDNFELLAPRADVARRLESLEGAEEPEQAGDELVFTITKQGNAQHREWDNTVVARIVLTNARLRVETNSIRRANALRAVVEAHLGRTVRFRLRSEANTADLMQQARASTEKVGRPLDEPPAPEMLAVIRDFRERHMTAWLDDSIPALGGLTPREAARLPRARPALEVLLKEFERAEARLPPEERIDVGRLRTALVLPRPG